MQRANLQAAVSGSVFGAVMLPLRLVFWMLNGLLWLASPAFLFAALLHYSAGDVSKAVRDVVFLLICAIGLGFVRYARVRLRVS